MTTRSDIADARERIDFATTEIHRWGMVLAALTDRRSKLRRGVAEGAGDRVLQRFRRVVAGSPSDDAGDRRLELQYLSKRAIREGPGEGDPFFSYATSVSEAGSFPETFERYVSKGKGSPEEVVHSFEQEALGEATRTYESDPSLLDAVVELVEAGLRAAKAHREDAVDELNNEFDDTGTRTDTGKVQSYHESADQGGPVPDYEQLVSSLGEHPAVLLPVGLETRFVDASDSRTNGDELWIRVYPDDVHVDAHEPELTPQEERWGKEFWIQVYLARLPVTPGSGVPPKDRFYADPAKKLPDEPFAREQLEHLFYDTEAGTTLEDFSFDLDRRYREIKERAWGQLTERAGRERGAYVAHRTAPVDKSDSDERETATKVLSGPVSVPESVRTHADQVAQIVSKVDPLAFPDVEYRPGSWTKQPRARHLPDRWIAFLEWTDDAGNEQSATVVAPNTVREPLYMGPNPESVAVARRDQNSNSSNQSSNPSSTKEAVADGMEWMVDFQEAENAGMALRVTAGDLSVSDLPDGFDRVTVTGLKTSMGPGETSQALQELLETHHYTRGLELLDVGTPTNNHEGESGYREREDHVDTVDAEVGAPLTQPGDPTDGTMLCSLLGIGQPSGIDHPLAHVAGADGREWFDAYQMQSVLWPGTVGHYLRHVLIPNKYFDGGYTDAGMKREKQLLWDLRDHFLRHVRASGPIPSLRVGSQPYGVLPVTALDAHDRPSNTSPTESVYWFLLEAVTWLRTFWEGSLTPENVPRIDPDTSSGGRSGVAGAEEILKRDAVSNAYDRRHYYLEHQKPGYRSLNSYRNLSNVGVDFDPRIGRFVYAEATANKTKYPYYDMVAGRSDVEPIPNPTKSDSTFLDAVSTASTGDLIRLGYDYHTRQFPYLFENLYPRGGSIDEWSDLGELFDHQRPALERWANQGKKGGKVNRLSGLFETDAYLFAENQGAVGDGIVDMPPEKPTVKKVVKEILGGARNDHAENLALLNLLFVDCLDEWIGEGDQEKTVGPDGHYRINTRLQDGHERQFGGLWDVVVALRKDVKGKAVQIENGWPDGRWKLERLFYTITEAVEQVFDMEYNVGEGATTRLSVLLQVARGGKYDVERHGGLVTVDGEAFDYSNPHFDELWGYAKDGFERHNKRVFNATWNIFEQLFTHHARDYTTLAFTFKGDRTEERTSVWTDFREGGASAIPADSTLPIGAKVTRDLSLFDLVVWYSAINANLNVLDRYTDGAIPDSEPVVGASDDWAIYTAYEALNETSSTDLREKLGWSRGFRRVNHRYHPIQKQYGGHRWFGMLDAMRSEDYVGHDGTDQRLASFQASLRWLSEQGWLSGERVDRTDRLFRSTLDLASHRLDAWWSSIATRRLASIRDPDGSAFDLAMDDAWVDRAGGDDHRYELDTEAPSLSRPDGDHGSYLGAYGFVENLQRGENGQSEEYEYLQAPSVGQARTAAILRSGYRSHPSGDYEEKMKVDLSPERVRKARWILDGLRQGLWLGEMLGYFFERRLHEVSQETTNVDLEEYIADFREFAPLSEGKMRESGRSDPARRADPVDGYALYQKAVSEGLDHVFRKVGVTEHRTEMREIFQQMSAVVDSVADLITAENVHQLQQGNYSQAGRSLAALAEGKPPGDPDVVRTDREHVGVTHRLLALSGLGDGNTGSDHAPPSDWQVSDTIETPKIEDGKVVTTKSGTTKQGEPEFDPVTQSDEYTVRDDGEPVLNAMVGRLFPDPSKVVCRVTYRFTTDDGKTEHAVEYSKASEGPVSLKDLVVSPLDALYLAQRTQEAGASKLESHVAYYCLRHRPQHDPPIPNDATVDVEFKAKPSSPPEGAVTFGEFVELSRSVRDLVGEGRPADATDLTHPGDDVSAKKLPGPLKTRAKRASTELEDVEAVLRNRLALFGSEEVDGPETTTVAELVGGDQPGESDDWGDPRAFDVAGDVAEVSNRLTELAPDAHLESIDSEAGKLSGSDFLNELEKLRERLPAGPTDPEAVDAEVTVDPQETSIEGRLPVGEADVVSPPSELRVTLASDGDQPDAVEVVRDGDVRDEIDVRRQDGEFVAELELDDYLPLRQPYTTVELRPTVQGVRIQRLNGPDVSESGPYRSVRVAIVHPTLAPRLVEGSLKTTVTVESTSPAVRFRQSAEDVPVEADGRYEAQLDFGNATPGTPFEVVTTVEVEGESFVLEARDGRVLDDGSTPPVDDQFVSSLTVLPRLLWLDAHASALAPLGLADEGTHLSTEALEIHRDHSTAIEPRSSSQVTGSGSVTRESTERAFDGRRLTIERSTTVVDQDVNLQGNAVRELADGSSIRESLTDDRKMVGGKPQVKKPIRKLDPDEASNVVGSARVVADPSETEAGRLHEAIESANWQAIDREFGLMPRTHSTFDDAERTAVKALTELRSASVPKISAALLGAENTRGIVETARKLGLTRAVTAVGVDAPFGTQTFYSATDPETLADARARISAFLRDPSPSEKRWESDELLLLDGELVEFAEDEGLESEFGVLLSVVSDPEWNAETLSYLLDRPRELLRAVDDLLYHPEASDAVDPGRAADLLLDVATNVSFAQNDPTVGERVLAFDSVTDVDTEFASPLARFARGLNSYSPDDVGQSEQSFTDPFDRRVSELGENVGLLADAHREMDLARAFREGLAETLRRPMVRAAYFGIYGAIPAAAAGGSETVVENLVRQAEDVRSSVRERLAAEGSVREEDPVEHQTARLRALFGEGFQVLPPFEVPNVREIGRTFGNQKTLLSKAGPLPVETWLSRSARVRERTQMLRETLTYADAVDQTAQRTLDVGQLPHYPKDDWVGLDGVRPTENDRVSLVAHTDDRFQKMVTRSWQSGDSPRMAGLFVDEWVEQVPSEEETTAVSFRYDDPNSRPPQSILVAAPPKKDGGPSWTVSDLEKTIAETVEMTKYRAVDLESLKPEDSTEKAAIGQLLPALFFAEDTHLQPRHPALDFTALEQYGKYLEQLDVLNVGQGRLNYDESLDVDLDLQGGGGQ